MHTTPPSLKSRFPGELMLRFRRDPLRLALEAGQASDGAIHQRLGVRHLVQVTDPALVGELFTRREDDFIKPPALRFSKFVLGEGLLTSEGAAHHRQRKLVLPAFHRRRIAGYADVMVECTARRHDLWQSDQRVAIDREMMRLTLEIVARTLFSADVRREADDLGHALTQVLSMFDRATSPFGWILNRLPLPSTFRLYRGRARLNATIYRLIAARRASEEDPGDLLSMLLAAQDETTGKGMTDEQVRDEAMTLFLAGHETTALALAWAFYLLAHHLEAEMKLHDEVDRVLADRRATFDDLSRLAYTRQIVSEALRLYPPAWSIGRQAARTTTLGEYRIPKGWIVMVAPYQLHRDPDFWPDPERFDPERFAPEAAAERPKFIYLPFSVGRRGCIGEQFAWTEAILVLATLARRWRFRLLENESPGFDPGITLRPARPIRGVVERRA